MSPESWPTREGGYKPLQEIGEPLGDEEIRDLGYEPTRKGWRPLTEDEKVQRIISQRADISDGTAQRQQPPLERGNGPVINADAWSMGRVNAQLRQPAGMAKTYNVAMAKGNWYPSARDNRCTLVTPAKAEMIRRDCGNMAIRTWRDFIQYEVANGLAHRHGDTVCLFQRPFENLCPGCGVEMDYGTITAAKRHDYRRIRAQNLDASKEGSSRELEPKTEIADVVIEPERLADGGTS